MFNSNSQASSAHWDFNAHQYEYEMAVYFQLQEDETLIGDLDNYEVAAFCNGICRGVADFQTLETEDGETVKVGYLRIWSNDVKGGTITFKAFNKVFKSELEVNDVSVEFVAQQVVGLPSNPLLFNIVNVLMGDVNGDGIVNIVDVTSVISHILGNTPENFSVAAADVNLDGIINIVDVTSIIDIVLHQ